MFGCKPPLRRTYCCPRAYFGGKFLHSWQRSDSIPTIRPPAQRKANALGRLSAFGASCPLPPNELQESGFPFGRPNGDRAARPLQAMTYRFAHEGLAQHHNRNKLRIVGPSGSGHLFSCFTNHMVRSLVKNYEQAKVGRFTARRFQATWGRPMCLSTTARTTNKSSRTDLNTYTNENPIAVHNRLVVLC